MIILKKLKELNKIPKYKGDLFIKLYDDESGGLIFEDFNNFGIDRTELFDFNNEGDFINKSNKLLKQEING